MMPTLYGGFSPVRLQGWRISGRLPANGAHVSRPLGLLPAFVPTAASVDSPLSVGVRCAHKHRHSSGYAALPQEPSLRSGFCCPDPSTLIRPHPTHSQAQRDFIALQLIRPAFAVRCRLGHDWFRAFAAHSFSTCRPLRLRGVRRLYAPSSFTANAGLRPFSTDSALPKSPQIRCTRGLPARMAASIVAH